MSRKKNGIKDWKYYLLLDWKDNNLQEYIKLQGGSRLCDLNVTELNNLYNTIKK